MLEMDCICGKKIADEDLDRCVLLCRDCFDKLLSDLRKVQRQNIKKLCASQPIVKTLENGKPFFMFYLPKMLKLVKVKKEKTNSKDFEIFYEFGEAGLKRLGNLVGLGGFYYDTEYYWLKTPDDIFEACRWFNKKASVDEQFWKAIEHETVWDFLHNNWLPFTTTFRDALCVDILSLIVDLHDLDSLGVDVTAKLSEIKRDKIRGNIKVYGKMSNKIEFHTNREVIKETFLRIRNLRENLAHIASESRLAKFAKLCGFDVELSVVPDLTINGKAIDVKKPVEKYVRPEKKGFLNWVSDDSTEIENLSNHISSGFKQKVDIVAIDVDHLDRRNIYGFKTKWLGGVVRLEKALFNAIHYDKKGIVLLFKCRSEGCYGRVMRCKVKQQN